MRIESACCSDIGKRRSGNEDNFCFNGISLDAASKGTLTPLTATADSDDGLYVGVFDGVGGEAGGEFASSEAGRVAVGYMRGRRIRSKNPKKLFTTLCGRQNKAVCREGKKKDLLTMGSTAVSLLFRGETVWVCNLGDSRAYRCRNGVLTQLSFDHVACVEAGMKAPITQCLGMRPEDGKLDPFIDASTVKSGDTYLICSDGLTDMVPEDQIIWTIDHTNAPESCVQLLLNEALENGGRDNITIIICRVR